MNIIENEIPYLVEARTCGCNERGKSVSYHFIESSHALCMNKFELISGQIQACERLLKIAKEDGEIIREQVHFNIEAVLGLHGEKDGAVHHEERQCRDGYEDGEGIEEVEPVARELHVLVQGQSFHDISQHESQGKGDDDTGNTVDNVPGLAPP